MLGSGVYLDDVDEQFKNEAIRTSIIGAGIILVALLISSVVLRSILSPLNEIQGALRNIAKHVLFCHAAHSHWFPIKAVLGSVAGLQKGIL